ncbi:MAG: hypothetical protein LAT51_01570 [Flavobacteriaceae bacterium]|nr:hypothetical protein [Flavobacteriaceae bacterium]
MEFFTYLLKVSVLLTLFGVSYWLLLRKESFKNFNRKFLLLGLVLSFLLPGLQLKTKVFVEAESASKQEESALEEGINLADYEVAFTENPPIIEEESFEMPWERLLFVLYFSGLIFMLFKLTKQILALCQVLQSAKKVKVDGVTHYQTQNPINAFSFFNKVVYCPEALDEKALTNVLQHEQVHIEEKHSWDLLLANLAQVLLWFNPLVFWYRKLMDENLEFIADAKSVEQLNNKKDYQYTLLNFVQEEQQPALGNYFFKNSSIKTRIMMLNKQNSPQLYRFKSVVIIPILISFIALFQVETVAMQIEKEESGIKSFYIKNEQTQKIAQQNPTSVTKSSITITSEVNKKSLKEVEEFIASQGVKLKFSRIKRNRDGEIKRIKINMQSEDGSIKVNRVISGNQPIPNIELTIVKTPGIKSKPVDLLIKEIELNNQTVKKQSFEDWNSVENEVVKVIFNGKELDFDQEYLIKYFEFEDFNDGTIHLSGKFQETPNAIQLGINKAKTIQDEEEKKLSFFVLKKTDAEGIKMMKLETEHSKIDEYKEEDASKLSKDEELQSIPGIKILESISKDSSEEDIQVFAEHFNDEANVSLVIENLKRNKNGEITSIEINLTDDNTNSKTVHKQQTNKGITPILLEKKNKDGKEVFVINSTKERKTEKERKTFYIKDQGVEINTNQEDINASVNVIPLTSGKQKVLYVIDGEEVTEEDFRKLNPSTITEIKVEKDSSSFPEKDVDGVIFITTKKDKNNSTNLLLQNNKKIPWELLDQKEDLQSLMKYFNLLDDQIKSDFYNDLLQNKHSFSIYNNDDLLDEDALKKLDYKNILSIEKSENENTIFIKTKE